MCIHHMHDRITWQASSTRGGGRSGTSLYSSRKSMQHEQQKMGRSRRLGRRHCCKANRVPIVEAAVSGRHGLGSDLGSVMGTGRAAGVVVVACGRVVWCNGGTSHRGDDRYRDDRHRDDRNRRDDHYRRRDHDRYDRHHERRRY